MDDGNGATRGAQSVVNGAFRFTALLLGALTLAMQTTALGQSARVLESKGIFDSGGRKITVEIYTPSKKEKVAGILILHGAALRFTPVAALVQEVARFVFVRVEEWHSVFRQAAGADK